MGPLWEVCGSRGTVLWWCVQHKIDEIMQLLPDQEMVWAIVREHARRWSAMAKELLRGRSGSEDEAEKSPPPHKHADLDQDVNDAFGIEIQDHPSPTSMGHEQPTLYVAT